MYCKRLIDNYLSEWASRDTHKPVLLRGARQVGKSTAVKELSKKFDSFVEINFEKQPKYKIIFDDDLDVKRYPDGVERTLDENEYARHIQTYGYPKDLSMAIEKSMSQVKEMIDHRNFPFVDSEIECLYQKFLSENLPVLTPKRHV